ncbi:MAG: PAS domain S-box protein [Anaerolineae bacterium]
MITHWHQRILSLWRRVTKPLDAISDDETHAQARRLASVVAWSIFGILAVIVMRLLVFTHIAFDVRPMILFAALLAGVFALVLQQRIQLACWAYLLTMHAAIYIMWTLHIAEPAVLTLGYLPLLTLIVGALFPFHLVVLTAGLNQLIILGLYVIIPQAPHLGVALFMNASFSTAICVVTYARLRERQRLLESEQRYRGLMEINFEPVAIVGMDRKVINVNPAFEALAGLPAAQLIGQPIEAFASDDSKPLVEQVWGKPEGQFVRLKARSAHGREFMVEVRTSVQFYHRRRVNVMVVRDLSQETDFERERREYELRYQALFEHSYDGIFIINLDGTCVTANQRGLEMLGLSAEEFARSRASDFVHPDELALSLDVIERLKRGERIQSYQRRLVHKDGHTISVEITPTLVRDSLGNPLHLQSVVRDISERIRSEEERLALRVQEERARILRQMIDDFSHHVRTPLSNIKNSAYLMARIADGGDQQRHQTVIDNEIGRLVSLLDDLLLLARLETEAEHRSIAAIDLNKLLGDLMPYPVGVAPSDNERHWHFDPAPQAVLVFGDLARLRDAFQRLTDNARSYTPAGGEIQVQVREYDIFGVACVRVSDTGIGIAPDDLARIFESFYRADAARVTRPFSTGLGLSIARKVFELHRGIITVHSTLDVGTTFTVWLPTDLQSTLSHETLEMIEDYSLPSQDA